MSAASYGRHRRRSISGRRKSAPVPCKRTYGRPNRSQREAIRFALSLPGAYEDHPWDEIVAKVAKKVFVFFGTPDSQYWPGLTVKLRESHQAALGVPGAEPTAYGLGKHGWVNLTLRGTGAPPLAVVKDWIEESYRLVAPKRLIAELDARASAER